jgi:AcrR family transcriptional regulator
MGVARAALRRRVLAAVVREVAAQGYAETPITAIVTRAGVSRALFYGLFANKEKCASEAFEELALRLGLELRTSIREAPEGRVEQALVEAIVGVAEREPDAFVFVTHEAMSAGKRLLARRNDFIGSLAEQLELRWATVGAGDPVPDLPAVIFVGAVVRCLGMAMRRGEVDWRSEAAELCGWIESYGVVKRRRRWSAPEPDPLFADGAGAAPPALPRQPRATSGELASALERERLVRTTAAIVMERGYPDTTVADIAAASKLSRESFYRHFESKREAVEAAVTSLFEQAIAAMGGAFFASDCPWAERVWRAAGALATVLAAVPELSHVAFIESYAIDPEASRRADEFFLGFTIFLARASELTARNESVASIAGRAITAAMVELGALLIAEGATAALPALVPLGVVIAIAPFTGIDYANDFIDARRAERE